MTDGMSSRAPVSVTRSSRPAASHRPGDVRPVRSVADEDEVHGILPVRPHPGHLDQEVLVLHRHEAADVAHEQDVLGEPQLGAQVRHGHRGSG